MDKPRNYENVKPFGDFEPLKLGGHICRIMNVEETLSKSGREMIVIYLDIAEGEQKNYYKQMYNEDNRDSKKWGCIVYQLVHDSNGDAHRGFKTFNTAVEESNEGFQIPWGTAYCNSLKDKLIGGVFGREQYKKQNGELAWAVRCFNFRSVEAIRKGVPVPKDRLLAEEDKKDSSVSTNNPFSNREENKTTYYAEETVDDDDLPF